MATFSNIEPPSVYTLLPRSVYFVCNVGTKCGHIRADLIYLCYYGNGDDDELLSMKF